MGKIKDFFEKCWVIICFPFVDRRLKKKLNKYVEEDKKEILESAKKRIENGELNFGNDDENTDIEK